MQRKGIGIGFFKVAFRARQRHYNRISATLASKKKCMHVAQMRGTVHDITSHRHVHTQASLWPIQRLRKLLKLGIQRRAYIKTPKERREPGKVIFTGKYFSERLRLEPMRRV